MKIECSALPYMNSLHSCLERISRIRIVMTEIKCIIQELEGKMIAELMARDS